MTTTSINTAINAAITYCTRSPLSNLAAYVPGRLATITTAITTNDHQPPSPTCRIRYLAPVLAVSRAAKSTAITTANVSAFATKVGASVNAAAIAAGSSVSGLLAGSRSMLSYAGMKKK
jgi:hypothetical protein